MPGDIQSSGQNGSNVTDPPPPPVQSSPPPVEVESIRVRLPTFWNSNPVTWFIQAEAQFTVHRITSSETKYCLTVAALPPDTCDSVIDILSNPPNTNKYLALKTALVERHSVSEIKRLETLIDKADIGDRKPSEVLRSMKMLAGTSFNDDIVKNLWMRRLPQPINIALLSVGQKSLEELSSLADKIYEASQNTNICSVSTAQQDNNSSNELEQRLSKIESMIEAISFDTRSRSKNRTFQNNRSRSSRSHSRANSNLGSNICWYHRRFRKNAKKCDKPCNFDKKNNPN
ncbi:uncharacterized protein LOC129905768 [Episyrphus balteatus]|uniref:uncharacterized protein LOC129905768 n=1 Tax=Episyrphus balteatus TaxID=286459 RepID=UPI0024855F69|nr:uncharacterized protein LOC129905768 [Episyrphus balteatus]